MKDDLVYLRHMLDCLDAIGNFVGKDRDEFLRDRKTRKAVLRELQEVAESSQRLSLDLKTRHPEVPWAGIAGFRNVVVHNYLGLDLSRVCDIIERDLPPLRAALLAMLAEGEEPRKK